MEATCYRQKYGNRHPAEDEHERRREMGARAALTGLLANLAANRKEATPNEIARLAVAHADALIEELDHPKESA